MRLTLMCCVLLLMLVFLGLNPDVSLACAPWSFGTTPVGKWKTVDDATGRFKSLVSIWEENSKVYGRIEKVLDQSSTDPDPRCDHCQGELKNRPLIGMRILWDFKRDGAQWSGGKVLDPESGKIYKCILSLEDGGKRLKVRGFIGISLLGRTQYWLRDEEQ